MYRRYNQPYGQVNFNTPQNSDVQAQNIKNQELAKPETIVPKTSSEKIEQNSDDYISKIMSTNFSVDSFPKIFGRFALDDVLILALILIFLHEKIEDEFLLLLLVFLFVIGL